MEALFKILKEEGYNIEGEDPYYTITYTQDGTTQTYKTKPYKSFDDSYDIVGSDGQSIFKYYVGDVFGTTAADTDKIGKEISHS